MFPNYSWMDAYAKKGYYTWGNGILRIWAIFKAKNNGRKRLTYINQSFHVNDATKDVATVINWIKKKKKRKQNSSLLVWSYGGSGSWKYAITTTPPLHFFFDCEYSLFYRVHARIYTSHDDRALWQVRLQKGIQSTCLLLSTGSLDTRNAFTGINDEGREKIVTNEATDACETSISSRRFPWVRKISSIRRPMGPLEDLYLDLE